MNEVDNLIKNLAIHISEVISSGKSGEHEIAEKTKALAELVSARAMYFQKPCKESVKQGVMRAVSSAVPDNEEPVQSWQGGRPIEELKDSVADRLRKTEGLHQNTKWKLPELPPFLKKS